MVITRHHRQVERKCFDAIGEIERLMGMTKTFPLPKPLGWRSLVDLKAEGTATYIHRLQALILLAAFAYLVAQVVLLAQGWPR